jgi:CubicO group peptidase (beta-lactamase class C family)
LEVYTTVQSPSVISIPRQGLYTMVKPLSAAATTAARRVMDTYTQEPSPQIPGMVYCAVNKAGEVIFSHGSGKSGLNESREMTTDTVLWMASCTKLITSIACMQLVEQGILALDNSSQLESFAPELKNVKVLERDGHGGFRLKEKDRSITLRMLLNHTGKTHPCAQFLSLPSLTQMIAGFSWFWLCLRGSQATRLVAADWH